MNVVDKINKVEGMLREEYLIDKISNKYLKPMKLKQVKGYRYRIVLERKIYQK